MCMCWPTTKLHCTLIMHAQGCYKLVIFIAHQVVYLYNLVTPRLYYTISHIHNQSAISLDMVSKEKLVWLRKTKAIQP